MPAPSLTEYGKLQSLGLITHYKYYRRWYVQQGQVIITNARYAISVASKPSLAGVHTFTPDEVAVMLRTWLSFNPQWQKVLQSKPNLPVNQYDFLTDAMARFVAYDAYTDIVF